MDNSKTLKKKFRGRRNGNGKRHLTVSIEELMVNALAKKGYIVTRKTAKETSARSN